MTRPDKPPGPHFFCEDCDAWIPEDECYEAEHWPTGDILLAHEGDEVSVGGDGYGDRCAGWMDAPKLHFVEEEHDEE